MTDKDKIRKYLEHKGISRNKFYKQTGLSNGFLNSGGSLGVDKLRLILDNYPDFDLNWFFGESDEDIIDNNLAKEPESTYKLKTDVDLDHQRIPLYSIEATAGVVPLFEDRSNQKPIDFLSIPNLPKCDGAIFVTGDSMYPLLKSGDIVVYKQISDFWESVFWGEMYIVAVDMDGDEYVAVKFVQKSDQGNKHIKLVSHNKNHQDKEVSIEKVRAMALVKASVRINSMS